MYQVFDFDLPAAVTAHLQNELSALGETPLTGGNLLALGQFQTQQGIKQGVYALFLAGAVVYVGKADDVANRLRRHHEKVRGRIGLNPADVGFKCLLLRKSWSTSANEKTLISLLNPAWNNQGFGPKDPGKERDGYKPSVFDTTYPIEPSYPCAGVGNTEKVEKLLASLKKELPYLLRYNKSEVAPFAGTVVNLTAIPKTAWDLLLAARDALGTGWQATRFKSHMILYQRSAGRKQYTHFDADVFK